MAPSPGNPLSSLTDEALVERVRAGQVELFELLMRRHNARLYRAMLAILRDPTDAEDVMQEAYVRAYEHLHEFEGRAQFSTWLTRIAINEALGRRRATQRRLAALDGGSVAVLDEYRDKMMRGSSFTPAPDAALAQVQLRGLLESAIARLPESFRTVFVLREIEGMSVDEVAETLDIPAATVKTRDLRARRRLREALAPDVASALSGAFPFAGADCSAITERVVAAWCG